MDYGSLANLVFTLAGGAVAALAWLFKMHGDVRVLRATVEGEVKLREALQQRVDGFEQRVFDKLDEILDKLSRKADR
jgi:hypothetical protein